MKNILIWCIGIFVFIGSGALTYSLQALTNLIVWVDWYAVGRVQGLLMLGWMQGEIAKLMWWVNLFS